MSAKSRRISFLVALADYVASALTRSGAERIARRAIPYSYDCPLCGAFTGSREPISECGACTKPYSRCIP